MWKTATLKPAESGQHTDTAIEFIRLSIYSFIYIYIYIYIYI